jgi:hypothetical protein
LPRSSSLRSRRARPTRCSASFRPGSWTDLDSPAKRAAPVPLPHPVRRCPRLRGRGAGFGCYPPLSCRRGHRRQALRHGAACTTYDLRQRTWHDATPGDLYGRSAG